VAEETQKVYRDHSSGYCPGFPAFSGRSPDSLLFRASDIKHGNHKLYKYIIIILMISKSVIFIF
jgi:hypothetical protein